MSVLVEAISLIVPRNVLDVRYPGGTDEFTKKMGRPDVPVASSAWCEMVPGATTDGR